MEKQVIEFGGEAVGVVIPDEELLRFVAVKYKVWDLDSQKFTSIEEARDAVRQLMNRSHMPVVDVNLPTTFVA